MKVILIIGADDSACSAVSMMFKAAFTLKKLTGLIITSNAMLIDVKNGWEEKIYVISSIKNKATLDTLPPIPPGALVTVRVVTDKHGSPIDNDIAELLNDLPNHVVLCSPNIDELSTTVMDILS